MVDTHNLVTSMRVCYWFPLLFFQFILNSICLSYSRISLSSRKKNKRINNNSNYALITWKNQLCWYLKDKLNMSTICSSQSLSDIFLNKLNNWKNNKLKFNKVLYKRYAAFSKEKKLKHKTRKSKMTIHFWVEKFSLS